MYEILSQIEKKYRAQFIERSDACHFSVVDFDGVAANVFLGDRYRDRVRTLLSEFLISSGSSACFDCAGISTITSGGVIGFALAPVLRSSVAVLADASASFAKCPPIALDAEAPH